MRITRPSLPEGLFAGDVAPPVHHGGCEGCPATPTVEAVSGVMPLALASLCRLGSSRGHLRGLVHGDLDAFEACVDLHACTGSSTPVLASLSKNAAGRRCQPRQRSRSGQGGAAGEEQAGGDGQQG